MATLPPDANINQRLEFLVQSTESLHASLQEVHAAIAAQNERNAAQDVRLDKLLTITERLAAVSGDHGRRLDELEGR
jgi:hypothetical protein